MNKICCPACYKQVFGVSDLEGRFIRCPYCQVHFRVPLPPQSYQNSLDSSIRGCVVLLLSLTVALILTCKFFFGMSPADIHQTLMEFNGQKSIPIKSQQRTTRPSNTKQGLGDVAKWWDEKGRFQKWPEDKNRLDLDGTHHLLPGAPSPASQNK